MPESHLLMESLFFSVSRTRVIGAVGNLHDMILVSPELLARLDIVLNSIQVRLDRISPTQTHTRRSLP